MTAASQHRKAERTPIMFADPATFPRTPRGPAPASPRTSRIQVPRYARFMQADPIGYGDGMNLYAYVRGDPVNYVDPTGLFVISGPISCWNIVTNTHGCGSGDDSSTEDPSSGDIVVTGERFEIVVLPESSGIEEFLVGQGGRPFTDQTPQEQMRNCSSNDRIARALRDRDVQNDLDAAARRSRAVAGGTGYWEHGFWTSEGRNDVVSWGVGTSRSTDSIDPNALLPWFGAIRRVFRGVGRPNILWHTHLSGALSQADVNYARDNQISVVAHADDGANYCYPSEAP